MKISIAAFLASTCLVIASFQTLAQTSVNENASTTADARIKAVLESAIGALGGDKAIHSLDHWTVRARSSSMQTSADSSGGTLVWKASGRQFRSEFTDGVSAYVSTTARVQTKYTNDKKELIRTQRYARYQTLTPFSIADILLHGARDPACIAIYVGEASDTGSLQISIRCPFLLGTAGVQTWAFDPKTHLPDSVSYIPFASTSALSVSDVVALSDYRKVQDVTVPYKMQLSRNGKQVKSVSVESIDITTAISDEEFAAPVGGR